MLSFPQQMKLLKVIVVAIYWVLRCFWKLWSKVTSWVIIGLFQCSSAVLSSVWLCNPIDCSLPGSSVHGIFQARVLEWVAISYARWSSWPNDQTWVSGLSWIGRHICYQWANWKALRGDCLILNKSLGIFSIQMKFKIILLNEVPSKVKFR